MGQGVDRLNWVTAPRELPAVPESGRIALVDVAFANKDNFELHTLPFIERAGDRLVAWIDHHEHPAWVAYERDPRFVLAPRQRARACPELISPELVARLGPFEHLLAHADFDGLMSAVKLLGGGQAPYPEADEDARAVDSPGRGFRLSPRGERLARALDQALVAQPASRLALHTRLAEALLAGAEPPALARELDGLAAAWAAEEPRLAALADQATRPHPELLLLECGQIHAAHRKHVMCLMEARARVAVVRDDRGWITAGTFHDEGDRAVDLGALRGMDAITGYAWGSAPLPRVLAELVKQLAAG